MYMIRNMSWLSGPNEDMLVTTRAKRTNGINSKRTEAKEERIGGFEKAELSKQLINEMDSRSEAQELPDGEDGLPHEVFGATALPQELPADLLEMPAGVYKRRN
ncbi:hypothetical protein RRF57_012649 [Xylaria bambusicola]|uniref:Uncharacterized protein n=1 Tax=Xylaria bambusicola TaxID=326684 RepID=A0AAN7ZAW4_9PEZI